MGLCSHKSEVSQKVLLMLVPVPRMPRSSRQVYRVGPNPTIVPFLLFLKMINPVLLTVLVTMSGLLAAYAPFSTCNVGPMHHITIIHGNQLITKDYIFHEVSKFVRK